MDLLKNNSGAEAVRQALRGFDNSEALVGLWDVLLKSSEEFVMLPEACLLVSTLETRFLQGKAGVCDVSPDVLRNVEDLVECLTPYCGGQAVVPAGDVLQYIDAHLSFFRKDESKCERSFSPASPMFAGAAAAVSPCLLAGVVAA